MPLIEEEQLTIAELLREKGYHTGLVGKWHLGTGWRNKDGKFVFDGLQHDQKNYASSKAYVENGRSTPGPVQKNFEAKTSWLGLPW
ncbi:sulfatase-like hydrolase/transferase [Rubritalea profundi]|uniref:Sulfatase N-terminal domain-containing protein n=1 Tax=Rubritalea profundi TaxID=1658618 RepID=A0A2S7U244_9BACT|nr:sulfatase-like hydrolase/transferase [Rubritalea profundi]PQJ29068.1 hypothetical protein BSZ32_11585 [Rubritalea profundi]